MQQNMTKAKKQYVLLNPTVGYEEDLGLAKEVDLAIDFCVVCETPIVQFTAEKEIEDLLVSDPTWIERFNAEADANFEASFAELDSMTARLRARKRGAA